MTKSLSHTNEEGKANMVDISKKPMQKRIATAEGFIHLNHETVRLVRENHVKKGDVITIAEVAGIQAAKKTSELIPLCHPIQLTKVDVHCSLTDFGVSANCTAECIGQTGVEMEALTGVQIALLTVYDMCKAVDKEMHIDEVKLVNKTKVDL